MNVALDVSPVATRACRRSSKRSRACSRATPDDFAATEALRAVRAELARSANVQHERASLLRHSRLSFFDRVRAKRRLRNARRGDSE